MVFLPILSSPNHNTRSNSVYENLPVRMDMKMDTSDQQVSGDDWILAPIRLINTLTLDVDGEKRGRKRARQKSDTESSGSDHDHDQNQRDGEAPKKKFFEKPYTMMQNALAFATEELEGPGWILRPFRLLTRSLIDKTQVPKKRGSLALEAPKSSQDVVPAPKKHLFEIELDVAGFDVQDISVKVSTDSIVVQGKHEERQLHAVTHGNSIKQFTNTILLPPNVIREQLECKLTSNGTKLRFTAPLKCSEQPAEPDRPIPISIS